MNKTACIVINNEYKFEAIYYVGNNCPLNYIIVTPDGITSPPLPRETEGLMKSIFCMVSI
jgi:hypothetical protein